MNASKFAGRLARRHPCFCASVPFFSLCAFVPLCLCAFLLLCFSSIGCQHFNFDSLRSQSPEQEEGFDEDFRTKVETPLIGEYTRTTGLHMVTLQGAGLVTGLDRTGSNPPPSRLRTALLEAMRKRGVRSPNTILRSPSTALVIVRAYLPPLIKKGENFDVYVHIPEGSEATSLSGGRLLETFLSEQALVPGVGAMKGLELAKAKGPILISTGEGDSSSKAGVLRRGKVLGGGQSLWERDMALYLRKDFRSVRNAKRIADRIGQRFHYYDQHGLQQPLAEAKTDEQVELKILPKYKDNFPRFLQVVRSIAFRETPVARRVRMQTLKERLHVPQTAERAALELEAIGPEAVPVLKTGLRSGELEVRFHAAVALAYLDDPAGLSTLAEAVRDEPAFRVFALAALAAIDEAESHLLLRALMNQRSAETRYGAFRALTTLDDRDPFVRGEKLNDEFMLHVLDTKGDPMIHLTHRRKAEIVMFGADQRFETPIVVRAGKSILVTAAAESDTITVSRYEVGKPERREVVSTRVADVIRTVAEFGGTYPDVAQMFAQADKQHNTLAHVQIDTLPRAGRVYIRPEKGFARTDRAEARVGRSKLTPNLFDAEEQNEQDEEKGEISTTGAESTADENKASGADEVQSADFEDDGDESPRRFDLFRLFRKPKRIASSQLKAH